MTTCAVDDCSKPIVRRQWCNAHYIRWRRHGDPTGGGTSHTFGNATERFLAKVDRSAPDECWLWQGYVMPNGYGRFNVAPGVVVLAHRFAYELHHGVALPGRESGMEVDHVRERGCRHRHCVNPAHLEWVTKVENIHRGDGGQHWAAKTHCPAGHPYDDRNTRIYAGRRHCMACARRRNREHRARQRKVA